MKETGRCPICNEEIYEGLAERICESCGMSISNKSPYYALIAHGRNKVFCSRICVTTYVMIGKSLLEVGRIDRR